MNKKKEIWIWLPYFLPGYNGGGPVQSIKNLTNYLSGDYSIKIITKNRDFGENHPYPDIVPDAWITRDNYQILYLKYNLYLINLFIMLIKDKPDLIYCNGYFSLTMFLLTIMVKTNILKSRIIVAPRGEFHEAALSLKSFKKKLFLMLLKPLCGQITFHSTTELEKSQIKKVFKANQVFICRNFPSIPEKKNPGNIDLRKKNDLRILYLSRICVNKNLIFAIEVLHRTDAANKIVFNIVGPVEDSDYWEKCKALMEKAPKNITFNYIGPQSHDAACQNYYYNDLCFLPTFFESVSHVINESLLHGCPVLISDNTPWENGEFNNGVFAFNLADKEKFIDTINAFSNLKPDNHLKLRSSAENFAIQRLALSETLCEYKKMFSLSP